MIDGSLKWSLGADLCHHPDSITLSFKDSGSATPDLKYQSNGGGMSL